MPNHIVQVDGYRNEDGGEYLPVGSFFTIEAADEAEALTEAKLAAEDCGWDVEHTHYIGRA